MFDIHSFIFRNFWSGSRCICCCLIKSRITYVSSSIQTVQCPLQACLSLDTYTYSAEACPLHHHLFEKPISITVLNSSSL